MKAIDCVRLEVFDFMNALDGKGFLYYKVVKNKLNLEHPGGAATSLPDLENNFDIDLLNWESAKLAANLVRSIKELLNRDQLESLVKEYEEAEANATVWIMGMK